MRSTVRLATVVSGAKVGGRIVPFTYHLQMGEQVDIITQKNPNLSRDWVNPNLGFTHTSKRVRKSEPGLRNKIAIKRSCW